MEIMIAVYTVAMVMCAWTGISQARMNVLFLVSDDMRPTLNAYSGPDFPSPVHPVMHTPYLDQLARLSLLLKKAYVQQAVCSPSRASLLTGRRPDTTHVYDLVHYFREVGGNYTTIPQYFKQNGYRSVGMGKIFHPGIASGHDDPPSWSDRYYHAPNMGYWDSKNISWKAVSKSEYTAKPLPDQQIFQHAQETMRQLAPAARSGEQPFFMAVGFHRPHLPFISPEEFFSYYPPSSVHLPDNPYAPVDMPKIAWSSYGELRAYGDIASLNASGSINTTLPNPVVRDLRRAYYSAISYIDSLIGGLLKELDLQFLSNNTIVSFWGDHGWQLGEHGEWCKHTNFELAVHAPMMIYIPGLTNGIVAEQLTEFVDLFPTLVDAAGLPPLPLCPEHDSPKVDLCREGSSLLPLIKGQNVQWKDFAFSQYPRGGNTMGYTMRSSRYRYTEWVKFNHKTYTANWDECEAVELYDHQQDPECNWNHANDTAYADIRQELSKALHRGWRAVLPPDGQPGLTGV